MFDNIGRKIKGVAIANCVIGVVASIISGIVFIVDGNGDGWLMSWVLGPVLSWVGSFLLYGFGQLVENSDIIVQNMPKRESLYPHEAVKGTTVFSKREYPKKVDMEEKGTYNWELLTEGACPYCGETVSFPRDMLEEGEVTCPYCDGKIIYKKQ